MIITVLKRTTFMLATTFFIYACSDNDLEFDCESFQANVGDACDSVGIISSSCECITTFTNDSGDVSSYDCPSLMLNYGDYCGNDSYVDANCDCVQVQDSTSNEVYDCPELMLNFGDTCVSLAADSSVVYGIIDLNCDCN